MPNNVHYISFKRPLHHFTLIEMLVVIAIISVLASMLAPAIRNAVASANTIRCASNMKQMFIILTHYSDDNSRSLPGRVQSWSGRWEKTLYDTGFLDDRELLKCPEQNDGNNIVHSCNRYLFGSDYPTSAATLHANGKLNRVKAKPTKLVYIGETERAWNSTIAGAYHQPAFNAMHGEGNALIKSIPCNILYFDGHVSLTEWTGTYSDMANYGFWTSHWLPRKK